MARCKDFPACGHELNKCPRKKFQRPTVPKPPNLTNNQIADQIEQLNREGIAADFLNKGPTTMKGGCLLFNYKDQIITALRRQ